MKLILLLSVLCFTSASALTGDFLVASTYMAAGCKDADHAAYSAGATMRLGCHPGTGASTKYTVDGKNIQTTTYSSTDCSGTKTGGPTTLMTIDTCADSNGMSTENTLMSEAAWNGIKAGEGNLLETKYATDNCAGDITTYVVRPTTTNGKCYAFGTAGVKRSWSGDGETRNIYASTTCSGTAIAASTETEKLNICINGTDASGKSSHKWSIGPAASGGTKLTGFTSTLFLLCVALFTNSFL